VAKKNKLNFIANCLSTNLIGRIAFDLFSVIQCLVFWTHFESIEDIHVEIVEQLECHFVVEKPVANREGSVVGPAIL